MDQMRHIFETFFNNQVITITITKKEAEKGCVKYKAAQVNIDCTACNGTGAIDGNSKPLCKKCEGSGKITKTRKIFNGNFESNKKCRYCKDVGRFIENPCVNCNGSGKVAILLDVKIPSGAKNYDNILLDTMELIGKETYVMVNIV